MNVRSRYQPLRLMLLLQSILLWATDNRLLIVRGPSLCTPRSVLRVVVHLSGDPPLPSVRWDRSVSCVPCA